MKCFDFASRLALVPLPTDLQTLVQQYLGHAPIPSSIREITLGYSVLQMHDDDMYYRRGFQLFHNNNSIMIDTEQCFGNITQLQKNWILLDFTLINTNINYRRSLPYSGEPAVLYKKAIFFIKDNTLFRLPVQDVVYANATYYRVLDGVKCMKRIGHSLSVTLTNGLCVLYGRTVRYTDCFAVFRWRYKVYKINKDGIRMENDTPIFRFPHCLYIDDILLRDEWLFVAYNHLRYYACNLVTHVMYQWHDGMRIHLSGDNRFFAQSETTLYIF